jgi:hypothetical protein
VSVYDTSGRPKIAFNATTRTFIKGATWVATGGLALIASSAIDVFVDCPVAGTITGVKIFTAGGTGSCSIDVRLVAFASFPPTSGNSIVASDPPAISSGTDYSDNTLSGWTTAIAAGDVLGFHLTSTSIFTSITVQLEIAQAS